MSVCDRGGRRRPSGRDTHVPRPAGSRCLLSAGRDLTCCPGRRPTLPATCRRRHSAPQAAARGRAVVAFEKRRRPRFSRRLTRYDHVSSSSRSGTATAASTARAQDRGPPRRRERPRDPSRPRSTVSSRKAGIPGAGRPSRERRRTRPRPRRSPGSRVGRSTVCCSRATARTPRNSGGHRAPIGSPRREWASGPGPDDKPDGGAGLGTRHSSIRL